MVRRAKLTHEVRLRPVGHPIEHVHLEPALPREQCCEQPDGAGTRHEDASWKPHGASGDVLDVVPCLGDDARGLEQHSGKSQGAIDGHGEPGIHAKEVGGEPVQSLDAVLGVLTVAAHVPFARGTGGAGHGIGAAHDARDVLPRLQAAARRRAYDFAERLVAKDQIVRTRRGRPVLAADDFEVGAADAHGQGADEDVASRG